jgi:hypothetical protein
MFKTFQVLQQFKICRKTLFLGLRYHGFGVKLELNAVNAVKSEILGIR